jgi:hypothetical protein
MLAEVFDLYDFYDHLTIPQLTHASTNPSNCR